MSKLMLTGRTLHPQAERLANSFKKSRINRREYLATMAALGVSPAGAFALGGIAVTPPQAQMPKRGGRLRVSMKVKGWRDPRTSDGVEMSNVARQCNELSNAMESGLLFRAVAPGKLGNQRRCEDADAQGAPGHHLV